MSIIRGVQLGSPAALTTTTGLKLADGIRFDEWRRIGEEVVRQGEAFVWCIGDWIVYGENHYRRGQYAEALALVEVKYQALKNYAWVARRVERSTRVDALSWSHHRAVASLETPQQRELLDAAARLGWTVAETEAAVRALKPDRPPLMALTVRVSGDNADPCLDAARDCDVDPAEWAKRGLIWLALNGSPHMTTELAAA